MIFYLFTRVDEHSSERLSSLVDELSSIGGQQKFTFEWSDSSLVRAVEEGEWILLDNVNLVNAETYFS